MCVEDNLSSEERQALSQLRNNENIIIKPADKGSSTVIMDIDYYRDKLVLEGHLNGDGYKRVDPTSDEKVVANLVELAEKHASCLTSKEREYITNFEWKTSELYVLPKVHKCETILEAIRNGCSNDDVLNVLRPPDLKGRPIVAGCATPTRHLSELIEKILKPLVETQKSYVKDDWDFLKRLPRQVDPSHKLFSCDISSLYTSIPLDLGVTAIRYWLEKRRSLIDPRFTDAFIIDSIIFMLKNNNFLFDNVMWNQLVGTAMGHIFAPPYACLTIGYLEEEKLFKEELPQHYDAITIKSINDLFQRYMDDGTTLLPPIIECKGFLNCLNRLHPAINYTLEEASTETTDGEHVQTLNFLDIMIIIHNDGTVETDIYYKPTNSHKYLSYESFHPKHCKDNIPYSLAKRIIVFVTDSKKMEARLCQLRSWLQKSGYPLRVINKGIHDARLQGPAEKPIDPKNCIPFVTTHMSNYDFKPMTQSIRTMLSSAASDHLHEVFNDVKVVVGYKQPKNVKGILTKAKFGKCAPIERPISQPGIFAECKDPRCQICSFGYIQTCTSFQTANGTIWDIRSHINCNSKNVLYYLKCLMCNGKTTYTGKTKTTIRLRTNNHISSCRTGRGSNIFDRHVHECGKRNNCLKEPYFELYAFMKLSTDKKLGTYEKYLHRRQFDTMNR